MESDRPQTRIRHDFVSVKELAVRPGGQRAIDTIERKWSQDVVMVDKANPRSASRFQASIRRRCNAAVSTMAQNA
jgi:hypothetical protein